MCPSRFEVSDRRTRGWWERLTGERHCAAFSSSKAGEVSVPSGRADHLHRIRLFF